MPLRVCLVTPFSWSQPHDVNEHVAGVAAGLRALGHEVTVLAPSGRARELLDGRRALMAGARSGVVAVGPAFPISRRSSMGVPVGVRANLALALAHGRYDLVHGMEPGLPSLSYLALRDTRALAVATVFSPDRLAYPPGRAQRTRIRTRIDALLATSPEALSAGKERLPGDYRLISPGVDTELFHPGEKRNLIVLEWRPGERPLTRSVIRALRELDGWELVLLRTKPLAGRPTIPLSLRDRIHVRTLRSGPARAPLLNEAAIFVPALRGLQRATLEAEAAGTAIVRPAGIAAQPELAGAALARLAEDASVRGDVAAKCRAKAERESFSTVAEELDRVYTGLAGRRRRQAPLADPLSGREWILCDLHLHTSWSHDCSIDAVDLLDHAEAIGLGAIAVTDHNVFGGAQEATRLAASRPLTVIPGEEVKTDGQGEVIGLFLTEEIPRGLSFEDAIAAIREQGGLVYVPHPFDRMHTVPDPDTLHKRLADIDILETYNARLLFDADNDEAVRFARKYDLVAGAGSDAHVLQGLGTGLVRMRRFETPEEFLISLRTGEIIRRPKSLMYLQSLKWVAQAKERVR